jgi:hypothetical protein
MVGCPREVPWEDYLRVTPLGVHGETEVVTEGEICVFLLGGL